MLRVILLVITISITSVLGFLIGKSFNSKPSQEQYDKVVEQNKLLKKQLTEINIILVEKDKEYLTLTKQLLELDKQLLKQQENEEQIIEELSQLSVNEPTAALGDNEANLSQENIAVFNETEEQVVLEKSNDLGNEEYGTESSLYVLEEQRLSLSPRRKMPPSAFRISEGTDIIDDNFKILDFWEQDTSFTAREKFGEYYKISGYFVNRKWTAAKEVLLVPKFKTIRR